MQNLPSGLNKEQYDRVLKDNYSRLLNHVKKFVDNDEAANNLVLDAYVLFKKYQKTITLENTTQKLFGLVYDNLISFFDQNPHLLPINSEKFISIKEAAEAFSKLNLQEQNLVLLDKFEGFKSQDLADILGLSIVYLNSVSSRLYSKLRRVEHQILLGLRKPAQGSNVPVPLEKTAGNEEFFTQVRSFVFNILESNEDADAFVEELNTVFKDDELSEETKPWIYFRAHKFSVEYYLVKLQRDPRFTRIKSLRKKWEKIKAALFKLTAVQQQVLILKAIKQHTNKEISKKLKISEEGIAHLVVEIKVKTGEDFSF